MDRNSGRRAGFPVRLLATGFFAGYSPFAPGTAGSLVGLAIALLPGVDDVRIMSGLIVVLFVAGVVVSGMLSDTDHPDPPFVVIDEIAGMLIALFLLPRTVATIAAAFLLFRVFDIVKPFPARQAETLPGGWGIMLDDVAAGLYANLACRIIIAVLPSLAG